MEGESLWMAVESDGAALAQVPRDVRRGPRHRGANRRCCARPGLVSPETSALGRGGPLPLLAGGCAAFWHRRRPQPPWPASCPRRGARSRPGPGAPSCSAHRHRRFVWCGGDRATAPRHLATAPRRRLLLLLPSAQVPPASCLHRVRGLLACSPLGAAQLVVLNMVLNPSTFMIAENATDPPSYRLPSTATISR